MNFNAFKAFLIEESEGKIFSNFVDFEGEQLDKGNVVLRVAYFSVNFKDVLAATRAGRPCVGGS